MASGITNLRHRFGDLVISKSLALATCVLVASISSAKAIDA